MFRITVIVILALSVFGCFKLRGSLVIPDYLRVICIVPNDPYEPFQRELRYRLAKNKVQVLSSPKPGVTVLELAKPEIGAQALAYSSSDQVQRYTLNYTVNYNLITAGTEQIRAKSSITRSREISQTNNLLLTNESEERLVQKELLAETVTELLRQITTVRPHNKESVADSSTNVDNPC